MPKIRLSTVVNRLASAWAYLARASLKSPSPCMKSAVSVQPAAASPSVDPCLGSLD